MTYSQKYTLACFLQPIENGESFHMTKWPPHITLADVFAIELSDAFIAELKSYIATLPPIITSVKGAGVLGVADVWLVNETADLRDMHVSLVDILERHGAIFNVPEFTRGGFIAHITKQPGSNLKPGDEITVSGISLLDLFPGGDWQQRRVIRNF